MLFRVNLPHDILKNSLSQNEDIFIYDELHGVAVTVENIHGKKLYYLLFYFPSSVTWNIIDIQATDEHGAQIMYNCAVSAVNRCKGD